MLSAHTSDEKAGRKSSFNLKAAMVPAIGLILIGVLPELLKNIYSAYTDRLMEAYVTAGYVFLGVIFAGMVVMMVIDRLGGRLGESIRSSAEFGWKPGESYLTGKKPSAEKKEGKDQESDKS